MKHCFTCSALCTRYPITTVCICQFHALRPHCFALVTTKMTAVNLAIVFGPNLFRLVSLQSSDAVIIFPGTTRSMLQTARSCASSLTTFRTYRLQPARPTSPLLRTTLSLSRLYVLVYCLLFVAYQRKARAISQVQETPPAATPNSNEVISCDMSLHTHTVQGACNDVR